MSVTYGAGGSTRERTHATVERILKETSLTPAAHLTCVGATREEVDEVARAYWDAGVRHIVALRGDPPEPGTQYRAASGRLSPMPPSWSPGSRAIAPFDISVAAYPEMPPGLGRSRAFDLDNLKRKVDAGADRAITQFFFSRRLLLPLPDEAAAAGIDVEIVPGHPAGLQRRHDPPLRRRPAAPASRDWLDDLFEGLDDLPAARQLIAATVAAELCGQLYAGGVRHFHFYTLNRAELSYAICHLLGVRPKGTQAHECIPNPPRRSRQAHPDQGRRLRHVDPGAEAAERAIIAAGSTC